MVSASLQKAVASDEGLDSSAYSSSSSSSSLTNGMPELCSQAGSCVGVGTEEKVQGVMVCGSSLALSGYRFKARRAIDEAQNRAKFGVRLSWPCLDGDAVLVVMVTRNWLQSPREMQEAVKSEPS